MVLEFREQNHIARTKIGCAPSGGDKIDCFRGAACENNVLVSGRVDELRHTIARALVSGGGAIAQLVDAAMHVGVVVLIIILNCIEHRARLLRGSGVVEIH